MPKPRVQVLGKFLLMRALESGIDLEGLPTPVRNLMDWWEAKPEEQRRNLLRNAADALSAHKLKAQVQGK